MIIFLLLLILLVLLLGRKNFWLVVKVGVVAILGLAIFGRFILPLYYWASYYSTYIFISILLLITAIAYRKGVFDKIIGRRGN